MTTMTPTSFGWTLAALAMLAPGIGLAQQSGTGTLADLRASAATDKPVYRLGSDAIQITMALENAGSQPVILNRNFADHLHLQLYFLGPAGPIRAEPIQTIEEPEPAPPHVCYIDGQPVQAEPVVTLPGGYQYQETLPDARAFYRLPAGYYTVELRTSVATYPATEPRCRPNPPTFALLGQQTSHGELHSLPQPFTIIGDGDGDGYCYPVVDGQACGQVVADCDDRRAEVSPGAQEIPGNGRDDDCNSATSDEVVVVANQPPVANAGPDRRVRLGSLVTLNGNASHDPDGGPSPLSFTWIQRQGTSVTLAAASTASPTFTPTKAEDYQFELTVSDGQDQRTDSVTITVPILGSIDDDGDVDQDDLNRINQALNTAASGLNDLRDLNADGKIDVLDARKLVLLCTRPRCATK